MIKVNILTPHQVDILKRIGGDPFLSDTFYFSGGTALSEVYFQHRESIDLDFFTPQLYDAQNITSRLNEWSTDLRFTIESEFVAPTHIYFLTFQDNLKLKIDFAQYPYRQLDSLVLYNGNLRVDSLHDIAANKLIALTQRIEVKDFVDMYFLLQKYTFWDLKLAVEMKFHVEIDPFVFASDCMAVDDFEFLPKMIRPLELNGLRKFYRKLAKDIGNRSIS